MNRVYTTSISQLFCLILLSMPLTVKASDVLSNLSGKTGTSTTTVAKPRSDQLRLLRGITWRESLDRPCWFLLGFNQARGDGSRLKTLELCRKAMTNENSQKGTGGEAIVALQVCLNRSGNRLKGIKVGSKEKQYNPHKLSNTIQTHTSERSRCHKWYPVARCSGRDAAIGLRFHHSGGSVSGIQLVCDDAFIN